MFTSQRKSLFLIFLIFIAACIETDIYLPAFPDMMEFFQTSEDAIHSLLTWNFFGICVSGPIYGPLSDSFGRKKPLILALGLFFIGSVMTLYAENFGPMLWGRFLQGLGSGGCFTLGTAIIFDVFHDKKAVQAINELNAIVPFIMAAAPVAGGYLNHHYGFRSNFLVITLFVLVSFLISSLFFEETLSIDKRKPFCFKSILRDFKRAFSCLAFWQMIFIVGLLFATYMTFVSMTAVLFVINMGISKTLLPVFQAAILGSWLMASLITNRYLDQWGPVYIKRAGIVLICLGGLSLVVASYLSPTNPYALTGAMMVYAVGVNWAQGIYFPEGMELLPDIKGITSSLLTSVRLLITAVVVGVTASFYDGTIYPVTAAMFVTLMSVMVCVYFYERKALNRPI